LKKAKTDSLRWNKQDNSSRNNSSSNISNNKNNNKDDSFRKKPTGWTSQLLLLFIDYLCIRDTHGSLL